MERQNSQYDRSLIEASLDPLITISTEGKITDLNAAFSKITRKPYLQLINTDFFDYFTEPQKAREVYQQIFAKGFVVDYPLTIKNHTPIEVLFNGSVYKDENGNELGAVVVARDVTSQKADELNLAITANKELIFQNYEKEKRAAELVVANKELLFQNEEKEKRAAELVIANKELLFQNEEKEKRAAELVIANKELLFQNKEKEKRAAELVIANEELLFQNEEKEKRAAELVIANKELLFQNEEKEKRAAELVIANEELLFQNEEKEKRAAELVIANEELLFQNEEKEKRAAELVIADKELVFQNEEKEKRAAELVIADKELVFQNEEKEKRAAELVIADLELVFQNEEKEKRAAELVIADMELDFQNQEKEKRAAELAIADLELDYQNQEKEQRISETKKLEAFINSQKQKSQYTRSLIEASADPLVTISAVGKITDVNEASIKVTGVSREDLIGTDFSDYFTEPEKAREGYKMVFEKSTVTAYPLTIRHINGTLTDVLYNASVYKDDKGLVLGVFAAARDVTEQNRISLELIAAKELAEQAASVAEEAKSKAESAQNIAEEAVKAKQQFLSNMSHEIRTPMNAIIGFTKVVLKTELNAKQQEYISAIKLSGDSLIVLINDILDLAKVNSGKMTFEKIPFKLANSINAMLHLFETKTQEKNIKLVAEYDNKIPETLLGDPVRLHQIILNLVSNAVKFTSVGNVVVKVILLSEDDEKVSIQFSISDTGIGISEDKIKKIFESFQQATSDTARLYGGTGLGLSIVKHLVEAQGGTISVKSQSKKGSEFSFVLDFKKTTLKTEPEIETLAYGPDNKNIKVLVVEDIALNQLLMKTLLDDFGFERDIAANGKIAIEMLKAKSYDVILMDLQMPEMNGFEATIYIRNKLNSRIPIIALTADVTTVDLEKCKSVGMNDYIAKPVDERILYNKIIGLVKKPLVNSIINENIQVPLIASKCINLEYLRQRTKSKAALMSEMIEIYIEQTPILINMINESLAKSDWPSLKSAIHKLIPSFFIVGISKNYELIALQIQEYADLNQNLHLVQGLVAQIVVICNQACDELKIELDNLKIDNNE